MFSGLGTSTDRVGISIDGISTSYLGRCGWYSSDCSLYLENMNLTETQLPAGVFDGLEHWGLVLSLQGNKFRTLPQGLFRNLTSLRRLYLQNNGLEELPSSVCAKPCWFDILFFFFWWIPFPCSLTRVYGQWPKIEKRYVVNDWKPVPVDG